MGVGTVVSRDNWDACCGYGVVAGTILKLVVRIQVETGTTVAGMVTLYSYLCSSLEVGFI